jgi:hypothetical protein
MNVIMYVTVTVIMSTMIGVSVINIIVVYALQVELQAMAYIQWFIFVLLLNNDT